MNTLRRMVSILLLSGLVVFGCATMQPWPYVTEHAVYTQVYLSATIRTMFRTFQASRAALQDLDIAITKAVQDADNGVIEGAMKDGTRVSLLLRARKPNITEANIKVGTFGSEELSKEISKEIKSRV